VSDCKLWLSRVGDEVRLVLTGDDEGVIRMDIADWSLLIGKQRTEVPVTVYVASEGS
jgi:hypothetical protein